MFCISDQRAEQCPHTRSGRVCGGPLGVGMGLLPVQGLAAQACNSGSAVCCPATLRMFLEAILHFKIFKVPVAVANLFGVAVTSGSMPVVCARLGAESY